MSKKNTKKGRVSEGVSSLSVPPVSEVQTEVEQMFRDFFDKKEDVTISYSYSIYSNVDGTENGVDLTMDTSGADLTVIKDGKTTHLEYDSEKWKRLKS